MHELCKHKTTLFQRKYEQKTINNQYIQTIFGYCIFSNLDMVHEKHRSGSAYSRSATQIIYLEWPNQYLSYACNIYGCNIHIRQHTGNLIRPNSSSAEHHCRRRNPVSHENETWLSKQSPSLQIIARRPGFCCW
jgi:hypothetical protein